MKVVRFRKIGVTLAGTERDDPPVIANRDFLHIDTPLAGQGLVRRWVGARDGHHSRGTCPPGFSRQWQLRHVHQVQRCGFQLACIDLRQERSTQGCRIVVLQQKGIGRANKLRAKRVVGTKVGVFAKVLLDPSELETGNAGEGLGAVRGAFDCGFSEGGSV